MPLHDLAEYGLSADRGFLAPDEGDHIMLPADFAGVEQIAARLPALIAAKRVRREIAALTMPDIAAFIATASNARRRRALLRYGFLSQAYVWGEGDPSRALPATLAVPLVALADAQGVPPIMTYADYVLDNWVRIDKSGGLTLDNLTIEQPFAGSDDERWFVAVHIAIEATAGRALGLAVRLVRASDAGDAILVTRLLHEMVSVWDEIIVIFGRIGEGCDPAVYFNHIRPYLAGWHGNPALPEGLVYDGVARFGGAPQAFRGQTGSQSSILPAMDALFGIAHEADELGALLADLHRYRPPRHRAFIEDLRTSSGLRGFVTGQPQPVRDAFNACIRQIARFRTQHLDYAAEYIANHVASAAGNDPAIGTGGTPFMRYLAKHRDENAAQLV